MRDRSAGLLEAGFWFAYAALMVGLATSDMNLEVDVKRALLRFVLVPSFLIGAAMIAASHRMDR